MNLRQLRYFCELVEAGSSVHAAERLCVAPTAVSMQLGQLEEHLGGELFDRSRRPMQLTSLGRFFYPRARELLTQAARLDEEAKGIAAGRRGWLRIGFTRSVLFSFLPKAVKAFREQFPEVHLELVEMVSEHQPAKLRAGRIDVGIGRFIDPPVQLSDLDHAIAIDEPFMAALPSSHPLARQESISGAALAELPFILYPKDPMSPFGSQMLALLRAAQGHPVVAHEAVEIHTALALVEAGLGATMVGHSIAQSSHGEVCFLPLEDIEESSKVTVLSRKAESSRLVAAFLEVLLDSKARSEGGHRPHDRSAPEAMGRRRRGARQRTLAQ